MGERMLNKQKEPTMEEMNSFCGTSKDYFICLNEWIKNNYQTETKINFPYGNNYGWCIGHRIKTKLICNLFPEHNSSCVMIRLKNSQFDSIYPSLSEYGKMVIDHKYPCSDGGWIQYCIDSNEKLKEIELIIQARFSK